MGETVIFGAADLNVVAGGTSRRRELVKLFQCIRVLLLILSTCPFFNVKGLFN